MTTTKHPRRTADFAGGCLEDVNRGHVAGSRVAPAEPQQHGASHKAVDFLGCACAVTRSGEISVPCFELAWSGDGDGDRE